MLSWLNSLLSNIERLICATMNVWRDTRVPMLARVLLIIGALYVVFPYDWLPDFLPAGYIDDLGIVLLIAYWVRKLVPRIIFQDARKAAAHTVCGILCLNFAAIGHAQENFTNNINPTSPHRYEQRLFKGQCIYNIAISKPSETELSATSKAKTQSTINCRSLINKQLVLCSVSNVSKDICNCSSEGQTKDNFNFAQREHIIYPGQFFLLLFRGGQKQVYASENITAALFLATMKCRLVYTRAALSLLVQSNYSYA